MPAGDRVSPIEIEEVLCRTHLVPEAATFGVKRPTLGQVIVALMRPAAGAAQGTEALRTGWRRALRRCLLSAASTGTDALPRDDTFSIERKALTTARSGLFEST
ncbi:MAG: hypothetical protein IPM01_23910 [Burkholderiaceae bacterium]|nr:hypothetical protein [Burkholderiaceae bacterium]